MEVIKRGAEAVLYRDGDKVVKVRIKKGYRHPQLDLRIRKGRTRREAKLLRRVREMGINAPRVIEVKEDEFTIVMEYVEGETLKSYLSRTADVGIMKEVGRIVGRMHREGVVHGDLTTSNFIIKDSSIYVIDFGLGEFSRSLEDRAVDLVCFKKSYFATHSDLEGGWKMFLGGYGEECGEHEAIFKRMEEVERRARYL